jgi:hypothetical protein
MEVEVSHVGEEAERSDEQRQQLFGAFQHGRNEIAPAAAIGAVGLPDLDENGEDDEHPDDAGGREQRGEDAGEQELLVPQRREDAEAEEQEQHLGIEGGEPDGERAGQEEGREQRVGAEVLAEQRPGDAGRGDTKDDRQAGGSDDGLQARQRADDGDEDRVEREEGPIAGVDHRRHRERIVARLRQLHVPGAIPAAHALREIGDRGIRNGGGKGQVADDEPGDGQSQRDQDQDDAKRQGSGGTQCDGVAHSRIPGAETARTPNALRRNHIHSAGAYLLCDNFRRSTALRNSCLVSRSLHSVCACILFLTIGSIGEPFSEPLL